MGADAAEIMAELRGFAEGSTSARASLMRDAADAIERLVALNDLFLNMRDRSEGYMDAPPLYRQLTRGGNAYEWAATAVRRAAAGELTLNPPVPLNDLRDDDPQRDGWRYFVLTCPECGQRFSAGARVTVMHIVYPDRPEIVYHHGDPTTTNHQNGSTR